MSAADSLRMEDTMLAWFNISILECTAWSWVIGLVNFMAL